MFSLGIEMRYWLYSEPTDMRKSFHTLTGLVTNRIGADARNGDVYVFINKRRNRVKLLHYEKGGMVIYSKMLDRGTFGSIQEVIGAVAVAVDFYNNRRPHMSLGMKTPAEMAESIGDRDMKWKSWRLEAIKTRNNANIPENCLPLSTSQGPPSGLRPSVNP